MLLMPTSCGPGPPVDDDAAVDLSLTPHERCVRTLTQTQTQTRAQIQIETPSSPTTGIPRWLLMLLMLFVIVAQTPQRQVAAEKSKHSNAKWTIDALRTFGPLPLASPLSF
ncbi:hypothetical protein ACLKA6_011130 [Drosophila palustris]